VGERTRRVFRLGDRLRVRVSRVDIDERKIDFDLVEGPANKARGAARDGGRTPELTPNKRRKVPGNERPRSGKPAMGKSESGRGGSAAALDKALPDTVKAVNSGKTKSSKNLLKSSKSDKTATPARARGNKNAGRRRR
jgi:ribonuclease R